MAVDHLNIVERKLIDNLRTGTYSTTAGIDSGSAWATTDITVFGQFPEPEDVKYPCIILEMVANGIEEQFMGQSITSGGTAAIGELYGVGFNLYMYVDSGSSITVSSTDYKGRRLLNYLMNNIANVCMDCDFSSTNTDVVERHYMGFRDLGYNPELELWVALTSMVVVFKNSR
jgi:hypothetical protein